MNWMPIETAPTGNGVRILGACLGDEAEIHVYESHRYGSNQQFQCWNVTGDVEGVCGEPTHWQPLPQPPETQP